MNGNYAAATPDYAFQQPDGVLAVYNQNGARLYASSPATGALPNQPFELCIFHNHSGHRRPCSAALLPDGKQVPRVSIHCSCLVGVAQATKVYCALSCSSVDKLADLQAFLEVHL